MLRALLAVDRNPLLYTGEFGSTTKSWKFELPWGYCLHPVFIRLHVNHIWEAGVHQHLLESGRSWGYFLSSISCCRHEKVDCILKNLVQQKELQFSVVRISLQPVFKSFQVETHSIFLSTLIPRIVNINVFLSRARPPSPQKVATSVSLACVCIQFSNHIWQLGMHLRALA